MSTDWHIKCVDCDDVHRFDDANHRDDEMVMLIRHADSIAAIAELQAEGVFQIDWTYGHYGRVDAAWFKRHLGHQLMPIDEYGRLLDQCHDYVYCGECGTQHKCALKLNHDGPHARQTKTPASPHD